MLTALKEKIRDKTRDKLAAKLVLLGVGAELADRGRPEEKVGKPRFQRSLGIIDIADGPIRWVNIVKRDGSKDRRPAWRVVMGVPTDTAPPQGVELRSVRFKSPPVIGPIVAVEWQGEDHGLGFAQALNTDPTVGSLARELGNFSIRSHSDDFQGWTITLDRRMTPTTLGWHVIQGIARRLAPDGSSA